MPVTEIVVGLVAALAAAAVVYALMRGALAAARAEVKATDRSVDALRAEFAALAAATLEGKAKSLASQNAEQLRPLFEQLAAQFGELRQASRQASEANVRLGERLGVKLDEVGLKAQSLGRQAEEFVAALRGGNKMQGNWGEGLLAKVLEDAGLRRGENFAEQTGARDGLPDVTVFDGAHRKLLIDAKVNVVDFVAATNAARAGNAAESARLMKEHAKRVRRQVDDLAARNYPALMKRADADAEAVYSDIVIMFMPSEATYFAAVDADPTLVAHANAKRIVLATPQMLFGYLSLFKMALDRVEVTRNQEEIARRARQIVERMDGAFAALEKVGKCLEDAQAKYHSALAKIGFEKGAQNVATPARELAKLAGSPVAASSETMRAEP